MRVLVALPIALVTIVAGCSFPEIELVPEDAAGHEDVFADTFADTSDEADVDDSSGEDTWGEDADEDVGDATTDSDASTDALSDAQGDGDVGFECVTDDPCDCDGDGDKKPGPGCGGGDCDDGDPRRNSKVTAFQSHSASGASHGGDWNCDGTVERELGNGGVTCGGLALGPCAGTSGYKQSKPACGGTATFVECKVTLALLCAEDTTKTKTVTVKCR